MTFATVTSLDGLIIIVIVVLLVVQGFLALAETSLTRMGRNRAIAHDEAKRRGSKRLLQLVSDPASFLNSLLLVVLICQTVQTALITIEAERLFGAGGVIVALVINIVLVFVLSEAAPKTWAIQHPDEAALGSAGPVWALTRFWPLRMIARGLIGVTNVLLPGKGLQQGPFVSEEELLALADEAAEHDVIEADERVFISRVIEFGDTVTREVMVPRPDMITIEGSTRVADAMEIVLANGYSRVPVRRIDADDVIGILYARDLMRAERDDRSDMVVADIVRPAVFVPETKRVAELLPEMQRDKFHMAIVVDEYGTTAGLVTLEDLIEELVGEIVDEFDVEDPLVEPLPGGILRVDGRLSIDDANDVLAGELPEGDWNSIGGVIIGHLGHVPVVGETVTVPGYELRVDRMQGRRIARVRIMPRPDDEVDADGGDATSRSRRPVEGASE
ncbi:MAG: HlyC/CorC family transporter [Actinobacteria bacterium]|nr:HlyC/CorC family transporter [Actinomycetota bacterium]